MCTLALFSIWDISGQRSFLLIHNVGHLTDHEYLCRHMVWLWTVLTLSLSGASPLAYWSWVFIRCLNLGLQGILLLSRSLIAGREIYRTPHAIIDFVKSLPASHHCWHHIIASQHHAIVSIMSLPASHYCHHHAIVTIVSLPASCHCQHHITGFF